MLKAQLLEAFQRIYCVLPPALQRSFWIVMALTIVVALAEFALAGAVSLLGVVLASPQSIVQHPFMQQLVGWLPVLRPALDDPRLLLALLLCLLCGTTLLKTVMLALLTWRQSRYSQMVSMHLGVRLFQGYMRAPYIWHTGQKISDLITILNWRANTGTFLFQSLQVLSQLLVVATLLMAICCMAPLAGTLVVSITGLAATGIFRCSRRWVHKYSQQCANAQQTSMKLIHTGLNGIRDILICGQQEKFIDQYATTEQRYMQGQSVLPVFPPLPSWILEFVGICLLLGTALLLHWQEATLAHVSATLALLAAVAWRLLPIMNRVVQGLLIMQQQLPTVAPILQKVQEVEALPLPAAEERPCPLRKEIRFEHVCFRYPNTGEGHKNALQDISLRIPKGSMIGLIGPSGAGKSTIVSLLTGLYRPGSGRILVDGQELDDSLRAGWMRSIGYVPQSPFLLNGSLAENIAFSQWGQKIDRRRVEECCRMAAIDFLDDLEDGIDTIIGERGVRLSGGQLQRVSIARALYSRPQLIIFDEATSALDTMTEHDIQKTIENLRKQMTVIIIAHRLTTVEKCDWLYWIKNGEIYMAGNSKNILKKYTSDKF
ncbi:ABC transporter ATP-binding protein [Desulfovibrio piger]|uniref:Phospholipid-lipopolysaccharide ABC transporter n=1 Tax=Desulfovibrio piger TaxID=901 RepID=A0A1K1LEZ9_9BACT|nr:ABC transporter ATP-binding protein/permease [Desulfovibrio piger]SFV73266.1 Phospholipid-lipopolysaccharide ABC transporter [Desulfovibrio piger]